MNIRPVTNSDYIFTNESFPVGYLDDRWTNECHPCSLKFNNEEELVDHIQSGHCSSTQMAKSNTQPSFEERNSTTRNRKYNAPVICNICSKEFKNKSSLSEHRWAHSEYKAPWKCLSCDKVFPFKTRLEKHQLTHIDIAKRPRNYKCSCCQSTFFRKNDLWSHEKAKGHRQAKTQSPTTKSNQGTTTKKLSVHTKGYQCKDCDKVLASSGSLFNHRQSLHQGNDLKKRYSCPECEETFSLKQKMIIHCGRRHSKNRMVT